jgi:trimeric autotransporter adhesin
VARFPLCSSRSPHRLAAITRLAFCLCVACEFSGLALSPSTVSAQGFDPSLWVTNGYVDAIARTASTIYIGGNFTQVALYSGGGLPIDITSGSPAAAFPRVTGTVSAVLPDGSGGWYIAGSFTQVGAMARSNLARVLADGTVSSWNPNVNGVINAMAIKGSTLYIGGGFTMIGAVARNYIGAVSTSTGIATSWDPNVSGGSFPAVYALAISGTTVYVGGAFTTIGGQTRNNIAAMPTGSNSATTWDPNASGGGSTSVNALAVSGTTVYVGGRFTNIGGQTRNSLAALDATVATNNAKAWDPNMSAGGAVFAMTLSGTTVYAGGQFASIGGQTRANLAALDATTDTSNATAWDPEPSDRIQALTVSGSNVYVGGAFTTIGGSPRNRVAALDTATATPTAWNPNVNCISCSQSAVSCLFVNGSSVYVGGGFTTINGVTRNNIAALDAATGAATAWDPNANNTVSSMGLSGSTVYAGGYFTSIGGQTRNRIAALDATINTANATAWDPNSSGPVLAMAVSGSTVYAGGGFSTIGGQTRHNIAALDATINTANATAWDPNASGGITSLAVSGSTVYAGGIFTNIGGQTRNRIAALDATVNTNNATAWDANANGLVYAVAISGTTVYAGGQFTTIGGKSRNYIAALDATINTSNATSWNPNANSFVRSIAVGGGAVYAGGQFTTMGGQTRDYIAALNTSDSTVTKWNPNASGLVYVVEVNAPRVYVGGTFTSIGGLPEPSLAAFGASDVAAVPASSSEIDFALASAPNPAGARATVHFSIPATGPVSLSLFDAAGRRVRTIMNHESLVAGPHDVPLETQGIQPGLYFVRLEFGSRTASQKLLVMR